MYVCDCDGSLCGKTVCVGIPDTCPLPFPPLLHAGIKSRLRLISILDQATRSRCDQVTGWGEATTGCFSEMTSSTKTFSSISSLVSHVMCHVCHYASGNELNGLTSREAAMKTHFLCDLYGKGGFRESQTAASQSRLR